MRTRSAVAALAGGCLLIAVGALARTRAPEPGPRAGYFPNFVLETHEGKTVRFYDDLVRGKTVIVNFMYTDCKGT